MNTQIVKLFGFILVLYALLFGFTSYWSIFDADNLEANTANKRPLLEEERIERGEILAHDEKTVIAKDLKMPEGIAVAPDGRLIVAEVGAKRIVQIDPKDGTIAEIAANLPIGLPAAPGGLPSNVPTGVGVGATGVIYFSSDLENAIYKVVRK